MIAALSTNDLPSGEVKSYAFCVLPEAFTLSKNLAHNSPQIEIFERTVNLL
jgi:hypothetical protein